jgi:hypothetical protein
MKNIFLYLLIIVMFAATIVVALNPDMFQSKPSKVDESKFNFNFVSGTEYVFGQAGQVIVEARYMNGTSAIEENLVFIVGNISLELYDNATIDKINDNYPHLWYSPPGIVRCKWTAGGYYTSVPPQQYVCGCANANCEPDTFTQSSAMVRNLSSVPGQILGFAADFKLGIYGYCSGGECKQADPFMWIGDANTIIDMRGSYDGIYLDMNTFNLYERNGGTSTLLFDAPDPVSCAPVVCYGYTANIRLYIANGLATLVRDGLTLIEVPTSYVPSAQTTYGWFGNRIGTPVYHHRAAVVFSDNIYDIINGTSITEAVDCKASIWFPDKTLYIEEQQMILGPNGNGYVMFPVPSIEGVYEYQARCSIVPGSDNVASKSFHVSPPIEIPINTGIRAVVVK